MSTTDPRVECSQILNKTQLQCLEQNSIIIWALAKLPKQDHQLALSNYPHQPESNKSSLDNISLVSESVVRVDNDRS